MSTDTVAVPSTAATARPWSPVIDTHAHIFRRGLPLAEGATHLPARDFTAQDYLDVLDAEGVSFGMLAAASFLGTYNDYSLAALREHSRLRATAIVEPDVDPYVLRQMDRDGVVGIRYSLRKYPTIPDFSTPPYRRLLQRVQDLGWHLHLLAESERLAVLIPQLVKSGVNLVIDHFGVPDARLGDNGPGFRAVLDALGNGRTWIKLAAPYRSGSVDAKAIARRFLAIGGAEHLLWGSDWPWTAHEGKHTYRDTIGWFEDWFPDVATRETIGRAGLTLHRFV